MQQRGVTSPFAAAPGRVLPLEHRPAPASVAAIMLSAADDGTANAFGTLLAASIRHARRYALSSAAIDVINGLPPTRWAHAVAAAKVSATAPFIWLEAPLPPYPEPVPEGCASATGVGILLSPRGGQHGVNLVGVRAGGTAEQRVVDYVLLDAVCVLHRGPAWQDLCAAFGLLLQGGLLAVPTPEPWGLHAELVHTIVPHGTGVG